MADSDVVRALLQAYRDQDRAAAEALVAAEFRFTSPQDDRIDRAEYFQRCFPTADRFVRQQILQLSDLGAGRVFLLYEYTRTDGQTYHNVEYSTVVAGRLTETEVFFGGRH